MCVQNSWRSQLAEALGLEDSAGKNDEAFIQTAKSIEKKVLKLKGRILTKSLQPAGD